ncbi:TadE/TadG family type IV pilus assembly protein [Bosea sp. LjRoot237]|uniref:TadE/TadG family type IV pilus assembly protein n=1 Tax=Bosea sp. LjRoot237 TaxID=3342292 RepID=UPI003ECEEF31
MRTCRCRQGKIGAAGLRRPGLRNVLWNRFLTGRRARGSAMASGALLRDQRGVAAVEFGLVAIIMFVMMAGAVDLSQRVIFQRDLKRFATSSALAMANCQGGGDCIIKAITAINSRMALLLPGVATTELRLGSFSLVNNAIVWGPGLTNVFQGTEEVEAKALLLREGDTGVLVSVKATHDPIFLSFATKWGLVSKQFYEYKMQLSYRKV